MELITNKLKPIFGFWSNNRNIVCKFCKFAEKNFEILKLI